MKSTVLALSNKTGLFFFKKKRKEEKTVEVFGFQSITLVPHHLKDSPFAQWKLYGSQVWAF